jgi:hypothetical protein
MSLTFNSPPVTISDIGTPGFYQSGLTNFTLSTTSLVPSANKNNVEINGSYPSSNTESKTGEVVQKYNISYYYDGIPVIPSLTGITISVNNSSPSTTSTYLCGIKVYYGTSIVLSVTTSGVSGIGKFFYNPQLIVYTLNGVNNGNGNVTTGAIETDLTNVTNTTAINSTTGITGPLTFTNNNVILTFQSPLKYIHNLTVSAKIYNIKNESVTSGLSNTCMIYDPSSPGLINQPPIITNKNIALIGSRIWSGLTPDNNQNTITTLTNYDKNPTKPFYYQTPYDHTQLINTGDYNKELLYANYLYQTKGLVLTGLGYSNYTNYSNPDYSTIASTGYRYLTLCWLLIPTDLSSISSVSFKLNTCSENGSHVSNFINDGGLIYSVDANNNNKSLITCVCRLESVSTSVNSSGSLTSLSSTNTPWISGNNNTSDNTYVTYTSTFDNTSAGTKLYNGTTGNSISTFSDSLKIDRPSVVTFNVNLGATTLTQNTYLYLRLGFPMGNTVAFQNVTASVS